MSSKVLIDVDPGHDDAWAIYSLIKAEEMFKKIKVLGITVVSGNCAAEYGSINTLLVLRTLGRLDIPVYVGALSPILKKKTTLLDMSFNGVDGLQMVYSPEEKPSKDLLQKKHAVLALKDYIEQYPNEITLICLGPLTNIALLFKMYPEVISKIKEMHIMGGNHRAVGNITRCAEFNFFFDPEAANAVLAEATCPIKIVTWETCLDTASLIPFNWRIEVLGSNNNPMTKLMDEVERRLHLSNPDPKWTCCDNQLVVSFILPEIIKKKTKYHATVELGGKYTRGQMVLGHSERVKESKNVEIIEEIDVDKYKNFMLLICGHKEQ